MNECFNRSVGHCLETLGCVCFKFRTLKFPSELLAYLPLMFRLRRGKKGIRVLAGSVAFVLKLGTTYTVFLLKRC
jgi:hypothetical protein